MQDFNLNKECICNQVITSQNHSLNTCQGQYHKHNLRTSCLHQMPKISDLAFLVFAKFYCQVFASFTIIIRVTMCANRKDQTSLVGSGVISFRSKNYFMHQLFFSVYLLKLDNSLTKHSVSGSSYFRSVRRIIGYKQSARSDSDRSK